MEQIHIGLVERDTGVTRDVLRMWERRYRFPRPSRDRLNDRLYTQDQVATLQLIKRLVDGGHRPGQVVGLSRAALLKLLKAPGERALDHSNVKSKLFTLIRQGRMPALRASLKRLLLRTDLPTFLYEVLTPLNVAVGTAWERGELPVHKEHLYVEMVQSLLQDAIEDLPPARRRPRVLLATLSGEQHSFSLLMLRALCRHAGVEAVSLGPQIPLNELAKAARFHVADVVALSFSSAFPRRLVQRNVRELRRLLPTPIEIWIGGAGVRRLQRTIPGTRIGAVLRDVESLLQAWRSR